MKNEFIISIVRMRVHIKEKWKNFTLKVCVMLMFHKQELCCDGGGLRVLGRYLTIARPVS